MPDPPRQLRIFGREDVATRRDPALAPTPDSLAAAGIELEPTNPYWLDEEAAPHPNPELGCIRRGLCCRSSPGWFAPGEVERAAALLGQEPDAFVRRWLVVDSVDVDGQSVNAFAPVKLDRFGKPALPTGKPVDALYRVLRGPCVFFNGTGCRIYGARPYECRQYVCTNAPEQNASHEDIGRMWRDGVAPDAGA
ncbi:MAG: hypothetical protein EXR79_04370 [Myxococcales bacterium]|nr:hypothetical protein [Myxococcales bacterium]